MRALASSILVAATLALGACGGDDDNDKASNSATTTQSTTTQSTTGKQTKQGGTKKRSSSGKPKPRKQKSGASSGGGNAGSNGGTSTQGRTQSGTTPSQNIPAPFKTARTVCGTFLPQQIARQIKNGKKSKEQVARSYSKGWPAAQRTQAYKGCLAGLNKRK